MSEQDLDQVEDVLDDVADFDAFFAEQAAVEPAGAPLRLYGRAYTLPVGLPALVTLQLHRVQHSARPEDIRSLLGALFGPDALDTFTANAMTDRQLGVLLLWATANCAKPGAVSMTEAAELYDEREAAQGKARAAANRQQRRSGKGKGKGKKRPNSGARS